MNLLDLVGGTPLVGLRHSGVLAKLEYLNPGGSVKDRAALSMVLAAEASGALPPGGTIVEGTSGNTGLGLAQVAAARGYRMVCVLPDKTAVEKLDALRAYGAEVVLTPSALPKEHPNQVVAWAARIARETPGGWWADQYGNPANPAVHFRTTGPEIWAATEGRISHFVATIGTGGTISGTGRYLKEVSDGRVRVIGADPVTSSYNGGDGSPFAIEAAGHYVHPQTVDDPWPDSYHRDVVDTVVPVPDRESITACRELARTEGLLVGGSSGTAFAVARQVTGDCVVVLLPDSGRAYLSKYHSDTWCRRQGFVDGELSAFVSDVVPVPVGTPVDEARRVLEESGQPALPVVLAGRSDRFPPAAGEVLALLTADELTGSGTVGPAPTPPVGLGVGESLADALERFPDGGVAHLVRDGRLAGLVTRADLSSGRQVPVGSDRSPQM